ncbi:MAG: FKBP-type peptidyl-prolyl cis-trans isomerase [bacterium]|nr:FKBP-type peptidyl-prolyl cis-trans isomerase [bacterium]
MFSRRNLIVVAVLLVLAGIFYFATRTKKEATVMDDTKLAEATTTPTPTTEATSSGNVQTLDGGLKIEDTKIGTGEAVKSGDTISIHYKGTLEDGTKFDSSYDRGQPFQTQIGVGRVIQGWDKGVPGMKVGGKRKLIIPPALGYGAAGAPGAIPPNATLLFDVELIEIVK